jgi:hypothetical protein
VTAATQTASDDGTNNNKSTQSSNNTTHNNKIHSDSLKCSSDPPLPIHVDTKGDDSLLSKLDKQTQYW